MNTDEKTKELLSKESQVFVDDIVDARPVGLAVDKGPLVHAIVLGLVLHASQHLVPDGLVEDLRHCLGRVTVGDEVFHAANIPCEVCCNQSTRADAGEEIELLPNGTALFGFNVVQYIDRDDTS